MYIHTFVYMTFLGDAARPSVSTRLEDGDYPMNPDGAGASRIHSLIRIKPCKTRTKGKVVPEKPHEPKFARETALQDVKECDKGNV